MAFLTDERKLWNRGFEGVIGLDEAGRGPLAGPVVAAACRVRPYAFRRVPRAFSGIRDSKCLSAKQREHLFAALTEHKDIQWGIGIVSHDVIDEINIFHASLLAMKLAVEDLQAKASVDYLLIDGISLVDFPAGQLAIPAADSKVFSCMAASVLAKVTRDRLMQDYHELFPPYGFHRHKGYGTPLHFRMIDLHGPCEIHRRSFFPFRDAG